MAKVSLFLADGFEEIEGLTVVDMLRRAGADVTTVSITGSLTIEGSHQIKVLADVLFENAEFCKQNVESIGEDEVKLFICRTVKEKKLRYAIPVCLAASLVGAVAACALCRIM